MDNMASIDNQNLDSKSVARSEELVDRFLDAIWMERGLSQNTLGAYRADLMTLSRSLSEQQKSIDSAEKADLLAFIAGRVEGGAKPRSTARQLSSFRRFFRYIMREGMRDTDPTADIEMPRIGRSLPMTQIGCCDSSSSRLLLTMSRPLLVSQRLGETCSVVHLPVRSAPGIRPVPTGVPSSRAWS